MPSDTDDLRIREIRELSTPIDVMREFPRVEAASRTVSRARKAIHTVLSGGDDRTVVIVGPCSVHDPVAALDYAARLADVRQRLSGHLNHIQPVGLRLKTGVSCHQAPVKIAGITTADQSQRFAALIIRG